MYQASKYLPKFGKNSHSDNFSTERDQPYKEGKQTPLASPGVKATTNLNFHNRSENSNHGEHHPHYLIQNLDTNLLQKNKQRAKMKLKRKRRKDFHTATTPNDLNIEELMYRAKEWIRIAAARV